jgi:hypothetical protein
MNIREITQPIERKFSIELTENQLKLLGYIIGNTSEDLLRNWVNTDMGSITHSHLGIARMENNFSNILYVMIMNTVTK